MPFVRPSHTKWMFALSIVPDPRQPQQRHCLLPWDPSWLLLWDPSKGGHAMPALTAAFSRYKLGAVYIAFSDWILPPINPWEVLLLTSRGATVSGHCYSPLLLPCDSACLPLWPTSCGHYCICKCAPCPVFSFLPYSLLPSLGLLLYNEQRTLQKEKFRIKTWESLLAKISYLAKKETEEP